LVILGLTEENIRRLLSGKPIALKLEEIQPAIVGDLVIVGGKDEQQMVDDIFSGLIGPVTQLGGPVTAAKDVGRGRD
jgi:hypothetical protein